MEKQSLETLIGKAIVREEEAYTFYTSLQSKIKDATAKPVVPIIWRHADGRAESSFRVLPFSKFLIRVGEVMVETGIRTGPDRFKEIRNRSSVVA